MKGGLKKTPSSYGFTIIETMIFLAVSGLMFIVATEFINNKVPQAAFTQGMNSANSAIQTIINDVANGNYPIPPGGLSFSCGSIPVTLTPSDNPSNGIAGCSYIGKVLIPQTNSINAQYALVNVAGCQYVSSVSISNCSSTSGIIPESIYQEQPVALTQSVEYKDWSGGINITGLYYAQSSSPPVVYKKIGAIGIFGSLPINNSGVLVAGAQVASIVIFPQTSLGDSVSTVIGDINEIGSPSSGASYGQLLGSGKIVMCFVGPVNSGPNKQVGSITIGSSLGGEQLITNLELGQAVSSQC